MEGTESRVDGEVDVIRLETRFSRAISYCAYTAVVDGLLVDSGFVRAQEQLLRALFVEGRVVIDLAHALSRHAL